MRGIKNVELQPGDICGNKVLLRKVFEFNKPCWQVKHQCCGAITTVTEQTLRKKANEFAKCKMCGNPFMKDKS